MNSNINDLYRIAGKNKRTVIGLMSGTSVDGLDVAVCESTGAGAGCDIQLTQFTTVVYDKGFKDEIAGIFSKKTVDLERLCLLNEWIAQQHAEMINGCLEQWSLTSGDIDLIASHGQTIYHAPASLHRHTKFGNGTLQIGDGDHLAYGTGIITISDFRQKHIAAGGEGAPLAAYGDYLIFSKEGENRIMLNIGGIANFTYLPGHLQAQEVFCSDTGPGNTLMDAFIRKNYAGKSYDENAAIAQTGTINTELLEALKDHPFFQLNFPKTTGPELFNLAYLDNAIDKIENSTLSNADIMATLNRFSADTIAAAMKKIIVNTSNFKYFASGGGMHNPLLMQHISNQMPGVKFENTASLGINPDAKEAVLFAVLANEAVAGKAIDFGEGRNGIPHISMGKVSFPN